MREQCGEPPRELNSGSDTHKVAREFTHLEYSRVHGLQCLKHGFMHACPFQSYDMRIPSPSDKMFDNFAKMTTRLPSTSIGTPTVLKPVGPIKSLKTHELQVVGSASLIDPSRFD